jgi:hypothetical protein
MVPALIAMLSSLFKTRAALQLENLALRHQIGVLKRSARKRPKVATILNAIYEVDFKGFS